MSQEKVVYFQTIFFYLHTVDIDLVKSLGDCLTYPLKDKDFPVALLAVLH
ncbi:hypothetical protein [Streptococcus sobrinus]|uniref:Uncharacterized protein n=1 Tax=Streptococcus sobrinus W1703 TaxID=1227275 RepID=U2IJ97_9STRE|nr:hypothetical protein [Streptococcus sobrinus]ERJ73966.1 hypothetical protein HMPREF1557_01954 [Streptococcus sobrinus W1703]